MLRITLGTDTSGRPLVVDSRTLAKLRRAESILGHKFVIVQGSYRGGGGAKASAGTHDRSGVVDLRTWDLPPGVTPQRAVRVLRECGLIAWYRTAAQGFDPHIHAIDYGNPDLAPAAVAQVLAWERGRNGLASNGPDDGPRVPIPKDPPASTPPATEGDDDMWLDDAINVHDPAGRAETQQVTGRELLTALAIFLNSQPGPHQAYLEAARKSKVEK